MGEKNNRHRPRQRVLDALSHRQPSRVPFSWNFGPTPEMKMHMQAFMVEKGVSWDIFAQEVDDVLQVSPEYIGSPLPDHTDIWGISRNPQYYPGGSYNEISHYPLAGIRNPESIKAYRWPDPEAYAYGVFRDEILKADPDNRKAKKLAINVCGNPFEIYCWMTGLEESMVNLALHPELVHSAMDCITTYFETRIRLALERTVDLIDVLYFADDLGGQQNLLMSLKTYRKLIKPYHQRLFNKAHKLAPHASVMYHSDGAVFDILPDLIDAGIHVLEAVQIDSAGMDPKRLKMIYGDKLSFHGGISVQKLLPFAKPETVVAECRELVSIFGAHGGYIAAPTHAIQVGTPPENVLGMLYAVLGEHFYSKALEIARL